MPALVAPSLHTWPRYLKRDAAVAASSKWTSLSASNYFSTTGNEADFSFASGQSLVFCWWDSYGGTESIAWTFGTAAGGWYWDVLSGNAYFGRAGQASWAISNNRRGLNCAAVTRTAGGAVRCAMNGGAAKELRTSAQMSGVAIAPPAGATHYLGRYYSAGGAGGQVALVYAAHVAAELDDTALAKVTGGINLASRTIPHADLSGHASLRMLVQAADWDGSGNTVTAAGSLALSFTKTGTPVKTTIPAEDRYLARPWWFLDTGKSAVPVTGIGTPVGDEREPFARVSLGATTGQLAVELHSLNAGISSAGAAAVVIKENTSTPVAVPHAENAQRTLDCVAPVGLTRHDIWDGYAAQGSCNQYVTGLRVAAGSRLYVRPWKASRRLVVFGDSIVNGQAGTYWAIDGWPMKLRHTYRASMDVAVWGKGSLGLSGVVNATAVAEIAAILSGATTQEIWLEMGTNDWPTSNTKAIFKGLVGTFMDDLRAAMPSIKIYGQGLTTRPGQEGTQNAGGATPEDFRDAMEEACTDRAGWGTPPVYVYGPDLYVTWHSADVHPTNADHAEIAGNVATILGL